MSQLLELDSYVRHETGDWKVSATSEPVKVWRISGEGGVEEAVFPAASLTLISMQDSTWADPSDL